MKNTEDQTKKAEKIVKNHMLGTLAGGLIPFRIFSAAAVAGIQIKMIHSLSRLYEVEFSQNRCKSLIAALAGAGTSFSFTQNLAPLLKIIPVIGPATGMITMSVFSAASTFAVGKVFILHFESGGTLLAFDAEKMREYYTKALKSGKEEIRKSYIGVKP